MAGRGGDREGELQALAGRPGDARVAFRAYLEAQSGHARRLVDAARKSLSELDA